MRVLAPIAIAPSTLRRPHHHVLRQGRVTLAVFCPSRRGHASIKQAAVAHFGGFVDHHAHAVVDEHAAADPPWVDLNAGESTGQLAQAAGHQLQGQP